MDWELWEEHLLITWQEMAFMLQVTTQVKLDQIFLKHTTEEWLERFQGKIPVSPINDLREALENPFIRKQGMIQKIDHPTKPKMQVLSNPIKWNQERMTSHHGPHKVGENTQAILKEFGFSEAEISELQAEGVV